MPQPARAAHAKPRIRTRKRPAHPCPSARATRTPKKREAFLLALAETANVFLACRRTRVGRRTVYEWRAADAQFAKAWDLALDRGTDALEDEAVRRAHQGWLEPVYRDGRQVGTIRRYSDTLLIFMLKARRPKKFREHIKVDANVSGGVLCVGATAATPQDWAKKYAKVG